MRILFICSILTFSVNVVIKSPKFDKADKHCAVLSGEIDFQYQVFIEKEVIILKSVLRVCKKNEFLVVWVGCLCFIVDNTLTVEAYFCSYFNVKACACIPMYVCPSVHKCVCSRTFLSGQSMTREQHAFFFLSHFYTISYATIRWLTEPQMSNALQNPNYTRAIFHSPELFTGKEP